MQIFIIFENTETIKYKNGKDSKGIDALGQVGVDEQTSVRNASRRGYRSLPFSTPATTFLFLQMLVFLFLIIPRTSLFIIVHITIFAEELLA